MGERLFPDSDIFSDTCDGWRISCETSKLSEDRCYRYWCHQEHEGNKRIAAVVMLNPGSFNPVIENQDEKMISRLLKRDTTLRILREVFEGTGYNPYIINLFNLATTNPKKLMGDLWAKRDDDRFRYEALPFHKFNAVLFAYGNFENNGSRSHEITERAAVLRDLFRKFPNIRKIEGPKNKPKPPKDHPETPMHPMSWQIQRKKECVRKSINDILQE